MKYCPVCDAEYSDSHTSCTVCGIELAPEQLRGQPLDERQRKEKIVLAWRGGDPAAVSEVIHVLRDAGIRHHVQPTNEHLVFELGMPRPKYAVRVFASDLPKAKELLSDIRESAPFALDEATSDADPARDGATRDDATGGDAGDDAAGNAARQQEHEPAPRTVHEWNATAANLELWSGEDDALAELLEACLRENRIGVRREDRAPDHVRLMIMPADESASREIVREVLEATPPA